MNVRRSRLIYPVTLLSIVTALVVGWSSSALATSCADPKKSVKQCFDDADAVFLGQIWGLRFVSRGTEATVVVARSWKGVSTAKLKFLPNQDLARSMKLGAWFLIYASRTGDGMLEAPECWRHEEFPNGGVLPDPASGDFKQLGRAKEWKFESEPLDE